MNILMMIYFSVIQFAKQVILIPRALVLALQQKRRKILPNDREIERLDRLRNPAKYLGK